MSEPDRLPSAKPPETRLRGLSRLAARLGVTVCFIAVAIAAVYLGSAELTRRAEAVPAPAAAAVTTVSARPILLESGYAVDRVFIGQVEAQRQADISFELGGKLEQILVDEGDMVFEGQVLATLDTALLEAEKDRLKASRDAVEAQLGFAQKTVTRNTELNGQGFASRARLDEAVARQDELLSRRSELDASMYDVNLRIEKSSIRAPFAGRVTDRRVDGGETLGAGQAFLGLVEAAAPQVRIGVPLDVDTSLLADVRIKIGTRHYAASLATLRPDIDPLTRTRTALFELTDAVNVAFGQTARLYVSAFVEAAGLWVPATALKEGGRGQWTLLVADNQHLVRQAIVEVLHADGHRVFVRGVFPDGTVVIDQGPHRVTVGQRVSLSEAD
ncbi:efflux RND transporter periplasmic adaptor subunit [Hoeflea sp.]|uniref:efflux RND transporter periplasmic adaptor subunit n=1 Tax=Hoeflea sp. TaxID=1940281 RepID=UPI003B021B05